jgi:phosphoenolpyruvate carboxykinase (ATP)
MKPFTLQQYEIHNNEIYRNLSVPQLYEIALRREKGTAISDVGALLVYSGKKTGRSPRDKRIVRHPSSERNIDWGSINISLDEHTFMINRERAIDYLNSREMVFVVDAFAGWDPGYRLKIRVICTRAYHALFMQNMLITPSREELDNFGEPDYVIFNGGAFPANRYTSEMTSSTSIDLDLERREFVILGTEYAGEMKKGIFSIMCYLMPMQGVLPMHCSANIGAGGDVTVLFGLSGTGKTTLSADPERKLIGDDEHCWTNQGVFNIEGGCYAKAIGLSQEHEPEIFKAIRFGTVLENVIYDPATRQVDYNNNSITENTRAAYPIHFMENVRIPCLAGHPKNIIFLTADAFGVLPPVSKMTPQQASYHFISGYTAKVAGTEVGIREPEATFSACFGAAFMLWHPNKYAELLAEKIARHQVNAWLINTGWTAGPYGTGHRIPLAYTRAMVDAIHRNDFEDVEFITEKRFGLRIPLQCPGVPDNMLIPRNTWSDKDAYDHTLRKLVELFQANFTRFEKKVHPEICEAGPR